MKTIFLLCFVICCLAPAAASASDWDSTDTVLQALVIASLAVDRHQSNQFCDGSLHEVGWAKNVIGHHPTRKQNDLYFAGAALGHTAIAWIAPKHWEVAGWDIPARTIWQSFWFGVEVGVIHKNYQLGLSFGFQ